MIATPRGRLPLALLTALLLCLTGCNVVAMKQAGIERTLRDAGMAPADVRLGPDTLHYWAGGHGPTIVLLHGFGGSATWLWYPQVEDLARDHRVILPDLLWFGDSRSEARDFRIDHQVHAVEALLDQLGEHDAAVVGVSYGGLVANELANDRAAMVHHLVLVDTPGRVYTREDYRTLCRRLHADDIANVLLPHDADGVKELLSLAYYEPPWVPGFALEQSLHAMYAPFRDERTALLASLLDDMDGVRARPANFQAHAMVVWGREDPVFPLEIGERLAASLKAPIHVLEKARHAPNLEHPVEFNGILRGFLSGG